ncbi:FAD-dependent oxidoreductase [Legionella hackeliae]|uniref:Putative FAD dependent oxidoreductase n=1 Tax=Legionella hackeliae TaxID=449 RepID=A0A0A8ULI5_LEGHA|nr:FAD-dependent monooxygenase [Legionella hackeliae]KTD10094.1 FAD dependent oxidoreductase [Legionella hackeliae]CEK09583.1 putative FAD dependent oxidoreductase [Legionella hackeliae]STX49493.1 FAD dependent oxidoreductase [Legionella hackeliae]
MAEKLEVLVVGAGPVGLFCANELTRHGLHCRIVDKKSGLSDKSKALAIHIRSLDVLDDCGFIDEILTQGQQIDGAIFKSGKQQLFDIDFAELENSTRDFFIDLPQDKTEKILYQGLMNKGLQVEWETGLTDIQQHSDGVTATLKRSDGSEEKVEAFWVIACDGSHSTLRALVNAQFVGNVYHQTWWLADLLIHWDFPITKLAMFSSTEGPLACFPIGGQRYRIVMTAEEKVSHEEPTMADIERVFKKRCQDEATLSDPIWISQFGIAHRQIDNYNYGHIFFAGDAAHVHSPMGGQGLNTGIQDIYNLVWKLALVQKGLAKANLLTSYNSERHPIATAVLKKTGVMTRMFTLRQPFLIKLRNTFLKFITSFHFVRRYVVTDLAELNISYAKSLIVKKLGKKTHFNVGEFPSNFYLTELPTKEKQSLREILRGTMHHLFLFTGIDSSALSSVLKIASLMNQRYQSVMKTHLVLTEESEIPSANSVFFDAGKIVHDRFAITETTAVLIRPDKYIGLTQCPVNQDELIRTLDEIFLLNK